MRILFCCEFYAPSVGGVQEVMKQVAERLVSRGHEVTVATGRAPLRTFSNLNGVEIVDFAASGSLVRGLKGEIDRYRDYAVSGNFDVVLINAAQQWTFDALWPVLGRIPYPKILIPCGFSGLHDPDFSDYYERLPDVLREIDHLIFHASSYRDLDFVRNLGIDRYTVIPNGASEIEFSADPDPQFRERYGIDAEELLLLTVGTFTGGKGHYTVARAFQMMEDPRPATLILNGNPPPYLSGTSSPAKRRVRWVSFFRRAVRAIRNGTIMRKAASFFARAIRRDFDQWGGDERRACERIANQLKRNGRGRRVLIADLSRAELVQAFLSADLFVFASRVEYSPLVLYEAAAAGTPFLSVPVGNAREIAEWTGGGRICPADRDHQGRTIIRPSELAACLSDTLRNRDELRALGESGRKSWSQRFTWDLIAREYETLFEAVAVETRMNHGPQHEMSESPQ